MSIAARSRFARFSWATLLGNVLVILWGAYVRATGSGAGCGGHWPLCNGVVLPRQPAVETIIEFTHRLSSGLALLLVIGLFWSARRTFKPGNQIRRSTAAALLFMVVEALLGAGLVVFELVAGNVSIARAAAGAAHLLNTFLLLAALSLTASWSTWPAERSHGNAPRALTSLLGIGLIGVLFIGMTGAIAALGDTLFPSSSLLEGLRQDLDPGSNILLRLRGMHPLVAIGVSSYLIVLIRMQSSKNGSPEWLSRPLLVLIIFQLAAGALNVLLLAPVWLQLIHLLLADGVWIGLVMYADRLLFSREESVRAAGGLQETSRV
ncbi:MAG: COX15/CtaA family protein [Anaerolineales bacterium]